jgi:hypothetical protein
MAKKNRSPQIKAMNKAALLKALEKTLGVISPACKQVGIDRTTFYRYMREDEEFAEAVRGMKEVALDFVEGQLFKQIKEGAQASTIFYLKTQGKTRGYVEKQQVEHSGAEAEPIVFKLANGEEVNIA